MEKLFIVLLGLSLCADMVYTYISDRMMKDMMKEQEEIFQRLSEIEIKMGEKE